MKYSESIILINLMVIIYMLLLIRVNCNLNTRNKKMLIIAYSILGIDIIAEWYIKEKVFYTTEIPKILEFIKLSSLPIFCVIYANIFLKNIKKQKRIKKLVIFMNAILGNYILLEIILLSYQQKNIYAIYELTCIVFAIYFIKVLELWGKYYQNENRISFIIGILLLGITGTITGKINPELEIDKLFLTITSIFIYMYYNENTMYVDQLTELLNQASYKKKLENIKVTTIILLFDVDSFKKINDRYGHNFGDHVLSIIGSSIKEVYSKYGRCYRIGGDEFCVVLPRKCNYQKLNSQFVKKLETIRKFESRIPYVSIGEAEFNPKRQKVSEAIENADKDLYFWKEELKRKRKL